MACRTTSLKARIRALAGPGTAKTSRARLAAVGLVAAFALAGCKEHLDARSVPMDGYRTAHPIVISEQPENFDIPVGMRRLRIDAALRARIIDFAQGANEHGNGVLYVMVPTGAANTRTARWMAGRVRRMLHVAGMAENRIIRNDYAVDSSGDVAPIRLTYYRMKATVRACNRWSENLTSKSSNRGYRNFGCATQSNLAGMIADPNDLLHPRRMGPSDPERRSVVFDKYRKGESTATKYPTKTTGTVSDAAGE